MDQKLTNFCGPTHHITNTFGWKSAKNRPILGSKRPAVLQVFEDQSSGGLCPSKMPQVRAVLDLRPWPDPSLVSRHFNFSSSSFIKNGFLVISKNFRFFEKLQIFSVFSKNQKSEKLPSIRPTSSQMLTFNFQHFLCNEFLTFFRNALN